MFTLVAASPRQRHRLGSGLAPLAAHPADSQPVIVAIDHDAMTTDRYHAQRAEATWTASRRMIARRERPAYRIADTGDGITVYVIELPWIAPISASRQTAMARAREAIADWLDVPADAFDVERG
jgi:hypothetical protein